MQLLYVCFKGYIYDETSSYLGLFIFIAALYVVSASSIVIPMAKNRCAKPGKVNKDEQDGGF